MIWEEFLGGLTNVRCRLILILLSKLWKCIFSRNLADAHVVSFNNTAVVNCESHKHLGLILDKKLVFDHHGGEKILKANKDIYLITRFQRLLQRDSFLTYTNFYLDYADIIYDNPGNASFIQKLETIQHNASLDISRCFPGTSREKVHSELGLESLADRCFSRRLCLFYKIFNVLVPQYLLNYLLSQNMASVALRSRPAIYLLVQSVI